MIVLWCVIAVLVGMASPIIFASILYGWENVGIALLGIITLTEVMGVIVIISITVLIARWFKRLFY